jgi:AraC family transcriptional regulator, regulatory protein of adaptative response / methylated-DNA-[protein]-cysteine methyltransferase
MLKKLPPYNEMYNALLNKDSAYEGIFVVGVKTTGVFCRSTCPARKPKPENVEFFSTTKEALDAGFRPCKRCKPMQPQGEIPDWVKKILDEVENDPAKRWKDYNLRLFGINPNRLRRWFKQNHGMTFQSYLRLRRLGMALGRIKHGEDLTQTAFEHGYESLSGFREAIKILIGKSAGNGKNNKVVYLNRIETPLGPMLVGATETSLCLLDFVDRRMLETQLKRLQKKLDCAFIPGSNDIIQKVVDEITAYFSGTLKEFTVPTDVPGTDFQKSVWDQLQKIPYGKTRSYEEQAIAIKNPKAVRAVGRANGENFLSIIIPCHRVIGKDGSLTGYGGGIWRKQYLLDLEKKFSKD